MLSRHLCLIFSRDSLVFWLFFLFDCLVSILFTFLANQRLGWPGLHKKQQYLVGILDVEIVAVWRKRYRRFWNIKNVTSQKPKKKQRARIFNLKNTCRTIRQDHAKESCTTFSEIIPDVIEVFKRSLIPKQMVATYHRY